ncbi:MAG: hypothetical protein HUU02_08725 [Bacteroidetes bacterium]|nr:hypothetical protein [Bacteroidota bacterium]
MKRFMLSLALLVAATAALEALPKFATRQGAKCQSCHVNPTGKGMRSTFGSTYGREELTMTTFKEQTDIEDFSPSLNDFLTIGMDYRTLYYYREATASSTFFQMQADLYLDLRLNKKFRIYFDKGLYSGFEVFGLAKVLPLDGYIKLGNFVPSYGLKMDDHNLMIRSGPFFPLNTDSTYNARAYPTGLNFGQGAEDTGLELGFSPGIFTFQAAVMNGRKGGLAGAAGSTKKAMMFRGDISMSTDLVNFSVGGSYYALPHATVNSTTTIMGGFGVVSIANNLTLLGEYDLLTNYNGVLKKDVTGTILYAEANYLLTSGIDLKVGYEFYDPNNSQKDGTITRYTIGAELFPLTGVEVRPLYRISQEKPKDADNNEFHMMFHFYL